MDFSLSKQDQLFLQMIREFAEKEVKPLAAEVDESERFPMETVQKMAKLGIMGIPFPVEYGGAGGNNACVWACPGATVNISDGTFTVGADASGAGNSVIYSSGGTVNISGGFFYTDYSWNNRYYVLNLQNGSGGTIRVTGGTFVNMDPSAGDDVDGGTFVADGYTVVSEVRPDGDIWYTVVAE